MIRSMGGSAMSTPATTNPVTDADVHAWPVLAPLVRSYLPWSSGAIRPSALVAVLNDIVLFERRAPVECGGGMSTIVTARLLAELGAGHVTTLEHDPAWVAYLEGALAREGLRDRATILHAPLEEHPDAWDAPWYAASALAGLPEPIDLLLVDGPPAVEPGSEHARYTALPALRDSLADGATIFLDDLPRPGEQAVLERWEADFDLAFQRWEAQGIAVTRTGGQPPLDP